jgi:cell division protein FtsI (penicillin-binding protein 3)
MRKGHAISLPHKKRIIFCTIGLLLMFVVVMARLYYIQIIQYDKFTQLKAKQYICTRDIEPKRGFVYDRNGKELAISVDVDSIYADPRVFKDKQAKQLETVQKLSALLGVEQAEITDKLKSKGSFVWIARKITEEASIKIKELHLDGIGFVKEGKRFYPDGKLANQVVGVTGLDNRGLSGIEFYCDKYIKGEKGLFVGGRDALGRQILDNDQVKVNPPEGNDIVLTIDKFIQYIAERELDKTCQKYRAKAGTIVIQDTASGEILALANWPTFDPTNISSNDISLLRCRAVTDIYEPGSTFKVITASAALEEGIVKTTDKFFCENGLYKLSGYPIRDHEKEGWLTFQEVIEKSSNIGVAKVSKILGEERLYSYASNFGFGQPTDIQLPGEVRGILRPTKNWSQTSLPRIAFGQEVGVTPVQLITAISAVANKGVLMKPYIVQAIKDKSGHLIKEFKPQIRRRVISEQTARVVNEILKGVVKNGTGQTAAIDGFTVAGKTGTAQKIDPALRAYSPVNYVASFVGYLPADEPKVTILVIVDEPKGTYWGSSVCGPTFAVVAREIMRYLKVTPETNFIMARGK